MIAELQAEKERLDEAIQALERLSARKLPRRGRPAGEMKDQLPDSSPDPDESQDTTSES